MAKQIQNISSVCTFISCVSVSSSNTIPLVGIISLLQCLGESEVSRVRFSSPPRWTSTPPGWALPLHSTVLLSAPLCIHLILLDPRLVRLTSPIYVSSEPRQASNEKLSLVKQTKNKKNRARFGLFSFRVKYWIASDIVSITTREVTVDLPSFSEGLM